MEDQSVIISLVVYGIGLIIWIAGFIFARTAKQRIKKAETEGETIINKAKDKKHQAEIKYKEIVDQAESEAKIILTNTKNTHKTLISSANKEADKIISDGNNEYKLITESARKEAEQAEARITRLKATDKEIAARLRESRVLIDEITDRSSEIAADTEVLNEEDLLSSQSYQEDRKTVKAKLKKLAISAIGGIRVGGSDVNIGKFIAISTKADMAGALLLTTVEMLCSKTTANNGHQSIEKLSESIVATEALIKCLDSRAFIKPEFRELLVKRLEIEINFKKARQLAKEQQRELREQEREEKRARQEAEKIQKEAEKEERIKQDAIAEIERKMAEQSEADKAAFEEELERLKAELDEAHQKFERAKSRAQETKQGHVYIISNIGSFGEDVLKIGMTRRMEPMDRVKELGDASVPFTFDVHALIESEDAPDLESQLHKIFDGRRVNKINRRKEFFQVTLEDIERELEQLGINALINKVASADEYYQSIKLEQQIEEPEEVLQ